MKRMSFNFSIRLCSLMQPFNSRTGNHKRFKFGGSIPNDMCYTTVLKLQGQQSRSPDPENSPIKFTKNTQPCNIQPPAM